VPLALLGGCGGGGGGGEPGLPVVQPFTSWSAVQPNSTVVAQGMSQTASAGLTVAGNGDVSVTSALNFGVPPDTAASSATLTFGFSQQDLKALQLSAPAGSVSWNETVLGGGSVGCANQTCTATKDSGASEAVISNPYFNGWNYQSFGVWQTGPSTNATFGMMSFGAPTPVSGMPSGLTATYTGRAIGVYTGSGNELFGMAADLSTTVEFDIRRVTFTTVNTTLSRANINGPGTDVQRGDLNLSGSATYAAGTAQFAVGVTTQNTQLSGIATGRFYGPAAQEIGGVYQLSGSGQSMGGGFGGKRP
jgi:hypothetical protein